MEEFSERGLEVTVLSAVDLAAQLTQQRDLDGLRARLRHVWRRMLTSSQLCFTGDVLRQASRPGVRPATDLADALDHLAREWTRREVDDVVAACLGTTRFQLTIREESVHRGPDRSAVEVIEIGDPAVDLATDVVLDVFARVVAVDRRRDYIRLKHRDSRVVAAWDRRLHDCWWYDPSTDHQVDLAEPLAADPGWAAASESLIAAAQAVEAAAAA